MATLLITGANRGLGLEFTQQYLKDGWDVVACCRSPSDAGELQKLAREFAKLRVEQLEVSEPHSIRALADRLGATSIDLLINNAGIYSGSSGKVSATSGDKSQEFGTLDAEAWERVLRVNTVSPILIIETLLPQVKRGSLKTIVNITSKMGSLSEMGAGALAYRSSKTALNAAMRVIAHDLIQDKITIVNLHPGWVQTDMGGKSAHLSAGQSVTSMRRTIASLKAKDTGSFFNFDGNVIPW